MAFSTLPSFQNLIFFISLTTLCAAAIHGGAKGSSSSDELWCVAKNNAEDAALQSALQWACGTGGADCGPIQSGGQCYDPSDIVKTASFAFNDYFIKHGRTSDSCDFSNSAELTSLNPSSGNCKIPSSPNPSKGNFANTIGVGVGAPSADSNDGMSVLGRSNLAVITITLFFIISMIDL